MLAHFLAAILVMTAVHATAAEEPLPPRLTLAELQHKYADPADRHITIEGIDVVYRDEGRGPAVLLIHGSNSTMRTYDAVAARLSRDHRVVRFDIPTYGLSGPVPDSVVGRLRPSDVPAQILAHLGLKDVTVAGVSSGGTLAIFLAAEHPELVARLVISNAPGEPVDLSTLKRSPALSAAEARYGGYLDTTTVKPRGYWRIYADFYSGVPGRFSEAVIDQMYDFARRPPEPNSLALVGVVADQAKAIAAAQAVKVPVLLLWGAADPLLPAPAAGVLERRLVNASVSRLLLPDVSHYPPIEVPDRFATIVADYIAAVTPRTPN